MIFLFKETLVSKGFIKNVSRETVTHETDTRG